VTAIPSDAAFAAARDYARSRAGIVSFAVLGTDGLLRSYNAQEVYVSASVVKALFLVAYLRDLDDRGQPLGDADDSILDPMIRVSDNDAAQTIFSRLGLSKILAVARLAGMRHFTIYSCCWGSGQLTADDQVRFFARLPALVPREFRSYALRLLSTIVPWESWGVPAVSRPYWTTYFKGGWRETDRGQLVHQVARLEHGDKLVVICVLTDGDPSQEYGIETIEGIAWRLLGRAE
jgi:hypothetical protein